MRRDPRLRKMLIRGISWRFLLSMLRDQLYRKSSRLAGCSKDDNRDTLVIFNLSKEVMGCKRILEHSNIISGINQDAAKTGERYC
jgi:hypothetical protein